MIIPVVLSGGSGTRLWPLSRALRPKQFLNLTGSNTLFQDTILRLNGSYEDPLIVCNEKHRFLVAEQLRQINSRNTGIILEPIGKNTAPAIALAAFQLLTKYEDPLMLVVSADHIIDNKNDFIASIGAAKKIADKGAIVAFGANPNKPDTGYGYIQRDSIKHEASEIISFYEKPKYEDAVKFLESGNYLWNTGIFMFKASVFLSELKNFEQDIYSFCKKSMATVNNDLDFIRINQKEFEKCPSKSIDYAIMERTKNAMVCPLAGRWSDVGSWSSLWEEKSKDKDNNVIEGQIISKNVNNSYLFSSKRLMAVTDISNLLVIDTEDALFISDKKNPQNIIHIIEELKNENRQELFEHKKVYRPWGFFILIEKGENFQVKKILVNPGAKLSLQKHKFRSEHWIIVKGIAKITSGKNIYELIENQSTYIPKGEVHRLENNSKEDLEIIEIQTGSYLGEDDIIRLEDLYKRK